MNIFKTIKNWFTKVGNTVHKFVLEISDFALAHCQTAINFLQAIKKGIDTTAFTTLTDLVKAFIPGEADNVAIDRVVAAIKNYIPKACMALEIANDVAGKKTDVEKLAAILDKASTLIKDKRGQVYTEFVAMITLQLADGKLDYNEVILDTQYIYRNKETFGIK